MIATGHRSGRDIRDEYKNPTVDLVGQLRARRLRWAGKVLRREEEYLVRKVLLKELQEWPAGAPGGVLQDAPGFDSPAQLVQAAYDVELWEGLAVSLAK